MWPWFSRSSETFLILPKNLCKFVKKNSSAQWLNTRLFGEKFMVSLELSSTTWRELSKICLQIQSAGYKSDWVMKLLLITVNSVNLKSSNLWRWSKTASPTSTILTSWTSSKPYSRHWIRCKSTQKNNGQHANNKVAAAKTRMYTPHSGISSGKMLGSGWMRNI